MARLDPDDDDHNWERTRPHREQRDPKDWGDLDLGRGRERFKEERASKRHNQLRPRLKSGVKKILTGDGSAQDVLGRLSAAPREHAAELAAALEYIRVGEKNEFPGGIESKISQVRVLLKRLTQCTEGVSPDHIAKAFRAMSTFRLQDEDVAVALLKKFGQLVRFASGGQILAVIDGFSPVARHKRCLLKEWEGLFGIVARKLSSGSIVGDVRPHEAMLVLAKNNLLHLPLQRASHQALFGSSRGFDQLPLGGQIATARAYGNLGITFPEKEFSRLTDSVRKMAIHTPSELSASEIALYVSAVALLKQGVSQQLLMVLEKLFHEKVSAMPVGRERSRIIHDAIPAFTIVMKAPASQTTELLERPIEVYDSSPGVSNFEKMIGRILREQLHADFQHSVNVGMFPVDFVVTRRDGKRVNLESDGVRYHLLYDVTTHSFTSTYRGSDRVRDEAVRKQGVLVARIQSWHAGAGKRLPDIVRAKIAGAQ